MRRRDKRPTIKRDPFQTWFPILCIIILVAMVVLMIVF